MSREYKTFIWRPREGIRYLSFVSNLCLDGWVFITSDIYVMARENGIEVLMYREEPKARDE